MREDTTFFLEKFVAGNSSAAEELLPRVYDELHKVATNYLNNERRGHTLQATALVHEAYLRLIDVEKIDWQGRSHFMAIASRFMRRILVDYARSKLPCIAPPNRFLRRSRSSTLSSQARSCSRPGPRVPGESPMKRPGASSSRSTTRAGTRSREYSRRTRSRPERTCIATTRTRNATRRGEGASRSMR